MTNSPSKTVLTIIAFLVPLPLTFVMCYALLQTMTAMGEVPPQILAGAVIGIAVFQIVAMVIAYALLNGVVLLIARLRGGQV